MHTVMLIQNIEHLYNVVSRKYTNFANFFFSWDKECVPAKAAVSWKFSHCYFSHNFFKVLCSNYSLFSKKNFFFPIKKKQRVNNCFKPLILSVFYCYFQIKIRTKRKGKINLDTKYNIQNSVTLYKMNENFSFSSNN